jgi:hypothetical protein
MEKNFILKLGCEASGGILTNITLGGDGGDTYSLNPNKEYIRLKLNRKGENNPMYGKKGSGNPNTKFYLIVYKNGSRKVIIGGEERLKWLKEQRISPSTFNKIIKKEKLFHRFIQIFMADSIDDLNKIIPLSFNEMLDIEEKNIALRKMKLSKGKNNRFKIIDPNGVEIIVDNFSKFCKDNNLHRATFRLVAQGLKENYRGWRCEYY